METIPYSAFTNLDVRLRTWFDDESHGHQQLAPAQRIACAGYAMNAVRAETAASLDPASDVTAARLKVGPSHIL